MIAKSREAIEVGAFTWSRIQRLYEPDAAAHRQRCESEGLQCPQEIFTQLFHEKANDEDFAVIVRSIDWGRVRWEFARNLRDGAAPRAAGSGIPTRTR